MKNTGRDIFIVIETLGDTVRGSSLELFTAARTVRSVTGGQIIAVILGYETKKAVETISSYGPAAVIRVDDRQYAEYNTAAYTNALFALIQKYKPDAVMISASRNGKDLAPRLARRLGTGITANCTELNVDPDTGLISWNMPAPGGIIATILCEESRPQMGTICPGAFRKPETAAVRPVEVIDETVEPAADDGLRLIERIFREKDSERSITEADIVVAGGRGMGSAQNFELVRELARLLGAAVGASRSVVDAEWIDQKHLIGQTGKIIRPKLYIACGISGALQHMVGVENAECIVAINRDASAPIFDYADYAVVGDVNSILPALIEILKLGMA
ncbi:MAG: electron transfer flavoprotein subunit alpha/FixB family protein [Candidatus Onthomonas sp.]